ncbi:MAG: divalent metal cation transporter [Thermaerobacter sp.]|nr:divalent metal cation transporter [Thermaerobacter sp.]
MDSVNLQDLERTLPRDVRQRAQDRVEIRRAREASGILGRLRILLLLLGPGILVMIADNDAGGVITYAQTGASYHLGFFIPFLVLMIPVAFVVQEMTVRLGAVTRRGHAEMIFMRYGRFWGTFSALDLVIANALTLITEFIGIGAGLSAFGVPLPAGVLAGLALVLLVTLIGRYRLWERISLWIALLNLVFVPLALYAHPNWALVARSFGSWHVAGGVDGTFLMLLLANLGTTIAPWMLFFQQSAVVDKGLTPKEMRFGRIDTMVGGIVMGIVALAIVILAATVMHGVPGSTGLEIQNILQAVGRRIGPAAQSLFALGLVEAGLIAAMAITASTSWAAGEALGLRVRSLNAKPKEALSFYLPGVIAATVAAFVVLIPGAPLGYLNILVQVLATVFMPAALLFLLLLVNDREVMGSYVNSKLQNVAAIGIVGFLIVMNGAFGASILFPHLIR